MIYSPFVDREHELCDLTLQLKKKTASLVIVRGRRRIGKSRLIEEFAKHKTFYRFTGLPPTEKTTKLSQREIFAKQLENQFGIKIQPDDWWDLLLFLAERTKKGRVIILLDEISWMGSKDPDFLGKLKTIWDEHFKQNTKLMLVLCGSVSSWIDENILNNTGFLGRISLVLTLNELRAQSCNQLLTALGYQGSIYDRFKLLAVTGGVPRYIEEVKPGLTAEENIKQLCFKPSGFLFREFNNIFIDLFEKRNLLYKKIVKILSSGSSDFENVCEKLKLQKSGALSKYFEDLISAGFISRDFTWNIKTGEVSRLSCYRLKDNYVRFYLKYIEKNYSKIENNSFEKSALSVLPGWNSIMGLQFENLVLANRNFIKERLRLNADDIITDNPYFQRKTKRSGGCQIDYLIQTRLNVLFACEIKFSKGEIKPSIIDEMKNKLKNLSLPRGFSCFPVLIHVNGVHEKVEDSGYFAEIIDFSDLFGH